MNHIKSKSTPTPPKEYLTKTATVRLQYTQDHFVAFSCFTHDLKPCWLLLPAKDGTSKAKIIAAVQNFDLYHPDVPSLAFQAQVAANAKVARRGIIAIANGWLDDCFDAFVYGDRVFRKPHTNGSAAAAPQEPLVIACPDFDARRDSNLAGPGILPADMAVARAAKGTLEGWQDSVAKPALCSSPMVATIAAVFAAPLLGPMDIDAFILLLAGCTSGGKTTTLLPAASAIGIGRKKRMPTWKNTDAGLESWAHIEYPDMAFPIDELAHVGSEPKVFDKIDETAYMFDAGVNKKKHDATASAQSGRPRRVTGSSSIVITSYERTLAEIETIVTRQFRPGVRVRVVEIPMSVNKTAEGIFDGLPKRAGKGEQRTKFANQLTKDLRRECARNSGKVFVAYIKKVVANLKSARKYVRARMKWFTENTKFDRTKREEYRRIEHFAFLYGAGAYAIKSGFLPWSREQLLTAIRACYRAARASAAAAPNPKAALETSLMQRLGDTQRVVPWPGRGQSANDGPQIDGWNRQEGGHTLYRVKASAFRQWFPVAEARAAVEDLMVSKTFLVTGKNANRCYQERVPGGTARIGVYQFQIPADVG